MTPRSARSLLALQVGCAVPFVSLASLIGSVDRLPLGEGRCSSCGVEGYVIGAHLVAGGWLAGMVACAAAARRRAREGVREPGRVTLAALAVVALFVAASLVWHDLFTPPAFAAWLASFALFPTAVIWLPVRVAPRWRRPPRTDEGWHRRLGSVLASCWVSLTLLLPGMFAWVWV